MAVDWKLYNVIVLGIAFMFMFCAFQTCAMVEQSVIVGASHEGFTGSGYTSLAIIYAVLAAANWIAPSVISLTGPKNGMIVSGLMYTLFILSFLKPMVWSLYLGSVLVGLGAGVLWTAQGSFLTTNSDSETITRNSGIFWALLQCSLLFGNLYVYLSFHGAVTVTPDMRTSLFIVLSVLSGLGVVVLFFLRMRLPNQPDGLRSLNRSQNVDKSQSPTQQFVRAFQLLKTKEMLLLSFPFAYTGFELTFFSGVYGTSVGQNQHFGDSAKSLVGLTGIMIGVGQIVGGALSGLFGKRTNVYGRDPILLLGYIMHMGSFYLIFLNLPDRAPIGETLNPTYLAPSNKAVALVCAFMLGFGDASFNTQIYSILGFMFPEDSAPPFALSKFVQSAAAAGAFFYSSHLLLQWQLLIMVISGTVGTICFFLVEWEALKSYKQGYSMID